MRPVSRRALPLALALALAGCGPEACRREAAPPPEPAPAETLGATHVRVWLVRGETLAPADRVLPATPRLAAATLEALLAGPGPVDREAGLGTAIPGGTRLHGVVVRDRTAWVDLTRDFESGGGALSLDLRVGQVVLTLAQFPSIERVRLVLDGEEVGSLSGDGYVVDEPLAAADFQRLVAEGAP